ncbi:MAG TPA: hypothetical protein VKG84_11070 [Candidatus Acidoferrales bacterium]|nr:hypothetical protein [Candidatus Acidoferrales bacterium]
MIEKLRKQFGAPTQGYINVPCEARLAVKQHGLAPDQHVSDSAAVKPAGKAAQQRLEH